MIKKFLSGSAKTICFLALFSFSANAVWSTNNLDENKELEECIIVSTPTDKEVSEKGYKDWPIWSGSAITYPTKTYSSTEYCYFIEGEVKIVTSNGKEYNIKAGDLVIFNKGCTCTWYATKAVRKHYKFE